jgi:hypothetical protein
MNAITKEQFRALSDKEKLEALFEIVADNHRLVEANHKFVEGNHNSLQHILRIVESNGEKLSGLKSHLNK